MRASLMTTLLDSKQRAAATLVVALSVALAIALTPYATGLLGIPALYIVLEPVHEWLKRRAAEGSCEPRRGGVAPRAHPGRRLLRRLDRQRGAADRGDSHAEPDRRAALRAQDRRVRRGRPPCRPRLEGRGVDRLVRIRVHRDGVPGRAQPDDFLLRPLLFAAPAWRDLERGPPVHPVFRAQHREAVAAIPRHH